MSTSLFAGFAAVLGYGAAGLFTAPSTNAKAILDDRRLPDVEYASLEDMEKVYPMQKARFIRILT